MTEKKKLEINALIFCLKRLEKKAKIPGRKRMKICIQAETFKIINKYKIEKSLKHTIASFKRQIEYIILY